MTSPPDAALKLQRPLPDGTPQVAARVKEDSAEPGGQYKNPDAVFAFNPAEGWSRNASEDVASELRRRCGLLLRDMPSSIQDFVESYEERHRQLPLPLRLVLSTPRSPTGRSCANVKVGCYAR